MILKRNIYLIGPMGVGKTTIGRQLAKRLGAPFYDSDKVIEEHTGVDIATIFEFEGESGFRRREKKIIEELVGLERVILATGGGVVLDEQNRALLVKNGFVVYLSCAVNKLLERTHKDTKRPLLQTENPRQKIEVLLQERDPLYATCSDLKVNTGNMSGKMVVNLILAEFDSAIESD
ncbi:MAG: shikimate kinase AroK [Methylococcales bacterium]|nr:shikimate kinase AroK [Methylococcales bacterium]